jgi:hypothetical protein
MVVDELLLEVARPRPVVPRGQRAAPKPIDFGQKARHERLERVTRHW